MHELLQPLRFRTPGVLKRHALFIGCDFGKVFHRQPDVVEPFEQAGSVCQWQFEFEHSAVGQFDDLSGEVDANFRAAVYRNGKRLKCMRVVRVQDNRRNPILQTVLAKNIREKMKKKALQPHICRKKTKC